MKFPWQKTEPAQQKKRFVGMSSRASPLDKIVSDVKQLPSPKTAEPVKKDANLLKGLQPYLSIIADDLKRVVRRDQRSVKMKQDYQDFMEHFFGGNK